MGTIFKPKYRNKKSGELRESKIYWIQYYRNGTAERENTHSTEYSVAKRLLQSREGDVARGIPVSAKLGKIKIDELAVDVVTNYKINHKSSTAHVERRLRKHILPFFGGCYAVTITTASVERYIFKRQEAEASNAEINRELSVLKRAFSLGINAGKILSEPYIPSLKENNVRTGFFEKEQFEAILKYLSEPLQKLMWFFFITGWRKGEVLRLQWRQVDFKDETVILYPGTTKNKEGRVFPFTQELRELLREQRFITKKLQKEQNVVCPWVFHRNGRQIKSYDGAWQSARRKAGLPERIVHDFRRTAVRRLEQSGVPRSVAKKMTGHKTDSVYERYAIVSSSDLKEAAKKLDNSAVSDSMTN